MKRLSLTTRTLFSCLLLAVTLRVATSQTTTSLTASGTYVAVAPQLLRPGYAFEVSVTILKSRGPVAVTASLRDEMRNASIVTNQSSIISGSTKIIWLQVPLTVDQSSYTLVIQGNGNGLTFSNSTSITVATKSLSCFIQTDKATYKPGQKVLFRVIAVYPDLKPYQGDVNITMSDNSGNKIGQWLQKRNSTGVFSGTLQLADQPPLGTWSITADAQGNSVTKTFDVAEYVLPKYEVSVKLPSYYVVLLNRKQSQQNLHFTVSAVYTYGQPVKGRALVNISFNSYYYENATYKLMNVELKNGTADITLGIADLLAIAPVSNFPWAQTSDKWQTVAYRQLLVVANVTETLTGTVLSGNSTVQFTSNKYSLSFLDITPSSYKPGLTFVGFLQLSQYDGTAPVAADVQSNLVVVSATYYYSAIVGNTTEWYYDGYDNTTHSYYVPTYKQLQNVVTVPLEVTASGYMAFSLNIESNWTSVSITASYNDTSTNTTLSAYKSLSPFKSRDSQGIQLAFDSSSSSPVSAGETVNFVVKTTVAITTFNYLLLSKAVIVKSDVLSGPSSNVHQLQISFDSHLAQQLSPNARIVAWYITAGGEIVCDSLDFVVNGLFANQVSVSFDKTTVQPADNVTVNVAADAGSYVGLLAVDQSVLLLKSGNDVTQDTVLQEVSTYQSGSNRYVPGPLFAVAERRRRKRMICLACNDWRWWPYFTGGTDTNSVFNSAGVNVMTDSFLYATPRIPIYFLGGVGGIPMAGAAAPAGAPGVADKGQSSPTSSSGNAATTVRKNFPETWIWTEETVGPNGKVQLKATVPDTITSWVLSAFAVSSDTGLGIAPSTAQVTVFKPFFISLTLPYSIVRGEQFVLNVDVFNYMSTSVQAVVTLKRSQLFKVKVSNALTAENTAASVIIEIPAMDAATASFWIVADTLGQIPIEVTAISALAADAVSIPLLVKPEGIPQQYSTSVFISLSAGQTYRNELNVSLPSFGLIPGSEYIEVTVIGNLLGQSLSGLGSLLQMPYGCGEQNMLNFAPDVYILKYFQATGQSAGSIAGDALSFINTGYQKQLTYQRSDGSFSAFGNSDPSGSVWLSAFVIKCFHEARQFIAVDDNKIAVTLDWLLSGQYRNGSFFEPPGGRVIHTDMQGGSAGGVALTAYVLISLLENANNTQVNAVRFNDGKVRATQYLESQLVAAAADPYALSIICYALTLANSTLADTAFQRLNSLAINKDGMKHWHKDNVDDTSNEVNPLWFRPPYSQASSVDIEMTSYALLIYARRKDLSGGLAIAKWIVAQRNANGGFSSTQDTVVALQALAEFAALTSGQTGPENLSISLSAGNFTYDFQTITAVNSLILQSVEIPSTSRKILLNATGSGVGLIQLNVKYNVNASVLASSSNVQLTVDATSNDSNILVNPCASWSGQSHSGMAVMEIGLPSGYTATYENQLASLVKRVDVENDKLVLYFDQFNSSAVCVQVQLSQANVVDNVHPAAVKAYLYYSPDQLKTVEYQLHSLCSTWSSCCPDCQLATGGSSVLISSSQLFVSLAVTCLAFLMSSVFA